MSPRDSGNRGLSAAVNGLKRTMNDWANLIPGERLADLEPSVGRELLKHALGQDSVPESRRVFVNRTLRMETIRYVGFDLDWTLALYNRDAMSQLAFELTLDRLVERFGYPQEILGAEFRSEFCRRGLILDTEEGIVLKMNRHRYVGRAYHGRRFVDGAERSRLYRQEPINPSSSRFYRVDTLFELPEVNIFSEVIELANRHPETVRLESYAKLFQDTRRAIDSIHADDTLKTRILADLPRFLPKDDQLILALKRLALGGRRLILITNSEWYYTRALCAHLFDDALPGVSSWRDIFDLVVVSAQKPGFFRKGKPFIELDDDGEEIGEVEVPEWGGVYSGGSRESLARLLGGTGEQMLYVGDHIYGDILSSKLTSTWRTALVVSELEDELDARRRLTTQHRHLDVLRYELAYAGQRMDDLDDVLTLYRQLSEKAANTVDWEASVTRIRSLLSTLRGEHKAMRQHVRRLQSRFADASNPCWGSLFRQGSNKSLFGSQVDDFACVYTSRVSNLLFYGSNHYFRVLLDPMMHED